MKKLLPPTLFIVCIASMVCLWWLLPMAQFWGWPLGLIGLLPFAGGLAVAKHGSDIFEKKGTNIETFDAPDLLITNGIYKHSRNPMYLGFVLSLTGIFIILGTLSSLLVVLLFIAITDRWYIAYEEAAMADVFGEDYAMYKSQTRRWV